FIGTGGTVTFSVAGTLTTNTGDANFTILNSRSGTVGGTIGSDTFIKLTLADTNIGRDFNVFIDNTDGSIGPTGEGATVTIQVNGKLAVKGRIDVLGTLSSTGSITAGTLSATNVNAPSISVGAGGITQFTFPNELPVFPVHTITTNALTSTGGINFNAPDQGSGRDGGHLIINVPSLTFGPSPADNIQGSVTFNGSNSPNTTTPAGGGGTCEVNATGAITVGSPIQATSGLIPSGAEPSGNGGTVNLNSTAGGITVNSAITVSSADRAAVAPLPQQRKSRSGGNIN